MSQEPQDPLGWLEAERRQPGGSRVEFRQQLEHSTAKLIELAGTVGEAVVPVTVAFLEADAGAADEWVATDARVQQGCRLLEEACFLLLARQSPVAVDLRRVVATIRCVGNVERSGSLLRHVTESLAWVHPPALPEVLRDTLRQLGDRSAEVFCRAVQAWRDMDPLAAVELQRTDDSVDLLQKVLLTELYTGAQSVEESVSLALLARYYERIADHGVAMARQVTYVVTGERIADS